ncbi:hypothetical protein HHK36_012451 [Tetracentron sinense]|uniref:Transcription factor CBF/NF-Y/archaeal histone domain-containing protein n=1 Tax=Tetracentron sinense TaxID=13715 RepID=A0A834ZD25_TETSI|nr:hypothetical protein HHK36_012451 [Tetracentron sinense]
MEISVSITNHDVVKEEPVTLVSPENPTPLETIFLSNIDQAVAFPVETVYFFEVSPCRISSTLDTSERVKKAVSEVLLIPYYFIAGRLNLNLETNRLELFCNNAGVSFVSATSRLGLKDLGNLSLPNSSFHHLLHRPGRFKSLAETPVTRFNCGGISIGFMTNHCIIDGKSASEMFQNLASICRGEGLKNYVLYKDRTCIRARNPPQIKYPHKEYIKLTEISSLSSSFTSPNQTSPSPLTFSDKYTHKLFSFTPNMLSSLKDKAMAKCSSFEAIVAHLWRARTKAVFDDPDEFSTVLFAVDIRSKVSPPLPDGFTGNAVITAFATAKVVDLVEKPFSYCVKMMKEARERVTDEYVRSVIDWLEVYKGIPATSNRNFYVSAWWKLPFCELDFGFGKLIHGGPVVSGNDEFVLLLYDFNSMGNGGGINVWIGGRPESDGQNYKFSGASSASGDDGCIKEQDRLLPIANVGRIMKQILPPNAKISKEAKETMQECVSEFISFVTGEASDKCHKEKRKTVNGDDVCWALGTLGFDDYADPLKRYLHKYRELEGERANQNKSSNTEDNDEPSTYRGKQERSQFVAPTPLKFDVIKRSNSSLSRPY